MLQTTVLLIQAGFFITVSTVAVLTYRKAKNGLLNTVNTEYHKKVIERLGAISVELYEEFDIESENFWFGFKIADEITEGINEQLIPLRDKLDTVPKESFGIPHPKSATKLRAYGNRIKSDPFIPRELRTMIVDYLEKREELVTRIILDTGKFYGNSLLDGKYWTKIEDNKYWIHNRIMDELRKEGFGIKDCEAKVNEIRLAIQSYFEAFDPTK